MTNNAKREDVESSSNENPLDELRRRLSEAGPIGQAPWPVPDAAPVPGTGGPSGLRGQDEQSKLWAQRFRRLAEAVVEAARSEPTSPRRGESSEGPGVSCEQCEDLLDLYVDDELGGHDARRLFPLVWQHLRTCARCRQTHDLLADTLSRERAGQLPSVPRLGVPRLSFLQPHPPDAPWIPRLRPRIAGAPFGLEFSLTLSYLATLLSAPAPVAARAEEPDTPPDTCLLLSDTVALVEEAVAVEVTATRQRERPDQLHVQAIITGSARLPENLWARLTWADETRAGPVDDQGRADLGEVSLTRLQEALEAGEGRFEVAFEAQEEPRSTGVTR